MGDTTDNLMQLYKSENNQKRNLARSQFCKLITTTHLALKPGERKQIAIPMHIYTHAITVPSHPHSLLKRTVKGEIDESILSSDLMYMCTRLIDQNTFCQIRIIDVYDKIYTSSDDILSTPELIKSAYVDMVRVSSLVTK